MNMMNKLYIIRNDIIKINVAMGWRKHDIDNVHKWMPPGHDKYDKSYAKSWVCLPNPFKDANDDYAVLEWMRKEGTIGWHNTLDKDAAGYYKIGAYARAALKGIDHAPKL